MNSFPLFLAITIVLFASCSKNTDPPPRQTNNNRITGEVTVKGRPARSFVATGADSAFFIRSIDDIRNDTIYTISGADGTGGIQLVLINLTDPGTYNFLPADTLGTSVSFASYTEGEGWSPTLYYSTGATDTLGNHYSSGTYTILHMTDEEVEGTMQVQLGGSNGTEVQLENMSFKGEFLR